MDTLMGGFYHAADSICERIEVQSPNHPAAFYARATVIYTHIFDFEDTTGLGRFTLLTNRCSKLADQLKSSRPQERAILCYLRGSALAAQGLMFRHEKKLLRGLRLLLSVRAEFEEAIKLDSKFFDAYLGRGAYRHAVATNASLLSWLPIIPGREEGWKDLWLAVDSSRFSRYPALSAIVWYVIDERDFALADSICQAGLHRFPNSRNFLWPLLSVQVKRKHWAAAESTATALLTQFLTHPDNNGYDAIGLYHRLMICADSLGRPKDAERYAKACLETYRTREVAERRKDKLMDVEKRLRHGTSR